MGLTNVGTSAGGQAAFDGFVVSGPRVPLRAGKRDCVIRINNNGRILDSECDLIQPSNLVSQNINIAVTDSMIPITPSEFAVTTRTCEVRPLPLSKELLCQEPPRDGCGGVRPPLEICLNRRDIINPRPMFAGAAPEPLVESNCNDEPLCRRCLVSLADGRKFIANPPWRAELYAAARSILEGRGEPAESIARFREGLGKAPPGQFFTADVQERTIESVRDLESHLPLSAGRWDVQCLLAHPLNRIDLDLVVPAYIAARPADEGITEFAGLAWLRGGGVTSSRNVRLTLSADVPGPLDYYVPGWPTVVFGFEGAALASKRAPTGGSEEPTDYAPQPVTVSIHYGGMRFGASPRDLRMLQWSGRGWSDITQAIDTRLERITGVTFTPTTLIVAAVPDGGKDDQVRMFDPGLRQRVVQPR